MNKYTHVQNLTMIQNLMYCQIFNYILVCCHTEEVEIFVYPLVYVSFTLLKIMGAAATAV